MHDWMLDNGLTPHIVVDATQSEVRVPEAHVRDGRIVLNISDAATNGLSLGNDSVEFSARFGGQLESLAVPIPAVLGIYARESGQGMIFTETDEPDLPPEGSDPPPKARSHLKVVK